MDTTTLLVIVLLVLLVRRRRIRVQAALAQSAKKAGGRRNPTESVPFVQPDRLPAYSRGRRAMMPTTIDPACLDAFAQLLARPDPRDLPRRAHVCRCEGDPDRRVTRLPGILMAWLQRRHLAIDSEEPIASATITALSTRQDVWQRQERRVNPGLRVLRPTGTG